MEHVSIQYGKIRKVYSNISSDLFEQQITYTLHANHVPGTVGYIKDTYTVWIPIDGISESEWFKEKAKMPSYPKWVKDIL